MSVFYKKRILQKMLKQPELQIAHIIWYFSGRSSSSGAICIMIDKQTDYDFVYHIEIIPGKIQALKVKMYERIVDFYKWIWTQFRW